MPARVGPGGPVRPDFLPRPEAPDAGHSCSPLGTRHASLVPNCESPHLKGDFMSYDAYRQPVGAYPWPAPAPGPAPRSSGGGLAAIGVVTVLLLLTELGILAYDISQQGVDYLPVALGFTYSHADLDAPIGFFGYDAALSAALLTIIIGAFSGRTWVRPAAVVLLSVNGYAAAAMTINQLGTSYGREAFAHNLTNLLLNLTHLFSVAAAVIVAVIVAATRATAPRTGAPTGAPYAAYTPYGPPAPLPTQPASPPPSAPPLPTTQPPLPPLPQNGPPR